MESMTLHFFYVYYKLYSNMANEKIYSIKINGISESINAVDALNKQLNTLESRIKALESSSVKVGSSGGGSKASSLSEEEKLAKQIEQIDAKREAYSKEIYQNYLAAKDVLKETVNDQKQLAASERLASNAYSNTMEGMKQHLADLKSAISTTDLGDSDKIKQMTSEANELTTKLKKMEEAYGQFGRNVGNYQDAANGFKGLAIQVGDTTQKFDNAKQAYKELSNELRTLQVKKDQGILLSAEEEKRFKELPTVVAQIKSSIQDAGKPMDTLMDSMQSIVALAQAGKGISAFFGLDGDEIERSIQKLVALQNAMKGLETINKQLQSGEFMGGMLSKANGMIDAFTAKILGASKAQETLSTTAMAAEVSSEGLTAAETAQAVATTTTTVATKALSLALKSIGIGLVIAAVATLIEYWEDIVGWFEDTVPALKNLGTWFDKLKAILAGVGTALVKWVIAPFKLAADVISAILDGRFSDLPKVIGNSLKDSYNVIENYQKGHNKAVENQQKKHNQKMREEQLKANEEAEKDAEARYGKDYARTQKHYKDQLGLLNKQLSSVKKGSDEYKKIEQQRQETQRKLWESERSQREENQKKATAANKKYSKELLEAENELTRLRINNMKEGLRKTITQLEEERKAKLAKVRQNGIMVAELEAEINKEYDRKIEDEKKKHAENVQKTYDEMWRNILSSQIKNQERYTHILTQIIEKDKRRLSNSADGLFNQGIASYGIQGKSSYSPSTRRMLDNIALEENYNKSLKEIFKKRIEVVQEHWGNRYEHEREAANNLYKSQLETARLKHQEVIDEEVKAYNKQIELQNKWFEDEKENILSTAKERKWTEEKTLEEISRLQQDFYDVYNKTEVLHKKSLVLIEKEYENQQIELENEKGDKLKKLQAEYYQETLQEFRDFQTALSNLESRQPVMNAFGIVNLKQTNKNNRELKEGYEELAKQISKKRKELTKDFQGGIIDKDVYQSSLREMDSFAADLGDKMDKVKYELSFAGQWEMLSEGINNWVQMVGQGISSIMSSLSEITQNQYEAQISQQEKYIEQYEKLLDKQKEATQKYADEVNSIEDELKTARGDRRQELIDQLNAQMAAQRASYAEEKRIEKQKEKAEEQKKKLEHDQAVAKKRMDLAQAYINAAMAVSMAAVNKWPIPAVPMMAMAAAAAAAQIAAIQSQNIPSYGDGGVIQGKSHAQGGVKVLGGRAEVEGGEFITNKATTQNNVELLDFINSRKKKLNLSDMFEFYGGKTSNVRKVINNASPMKFADGGQVPLLSNDIELNDRLVNVMEDYSNRPVVVSVVDINDRQAAVRNVEVLSGLNE